MWNWVYRNELVDNMDMMMMLDAVVADATFFIFLFPIAVVFCFSLARLMESGSDNATINMCFYSIDSRFLCA